MDAEHSIVELDKVPVQETWQALEQLVDEGITRSIGVSNFQAQLLTDVISYARHPVSSLQIEHHPYLVQPGLVDTARENGVAVTAYSSFGPQSFLELPPDFSKRATSIALLFEAVPVAALAAKYGKTPAQILLRWATQRGIAVIPKSNNPARLAENLDVASGFDLTVEELAAISNLDLDLRFNDPGFYLPSHPIHVFA